MSCAISNTNEFIVVWNDETVAIMTPDVLFQKFDSTGIPIGSSIKVDDTLSDRIESTTPKIVMDKDGSFIIVWQSASNNQRDILSQKYDVNTSPVGKNTIIVSDSGTGNQTNSYIAMNEKTDFVIVWSDNPTKGIFGKIYNQSGTPYKTSFRINSDTTSASQPAVAVEPDGNFITVWVGGEQNHIYGCKYNLSQGTFSPVFKADSGGRFFQTMAPDIGISSNGDFTVVWEDYRRE